MNGDDLQRFLRRLQWALLPATCVLCGQAAVAPLDLCAACRADLPAAEAACRVCALPLATAGRSDLCGRCQGRRRVLERTTARCLYGAPADLLVQALKFSRRVAVARVMATLMLEAPPPVLTAATKDAIADTVADTIVDTMLVPVPLHFRRRWQRGFDQAALLALHLSRACGRPLAGRGVRRVRATAAQSGLDRRARRANLAGAFAVAPGCLAAHVILVDDVMTSGATLEALARACRRAGARRVEAWVFARTPPGRRGQLPAAGS
ncbi:MAG TPA: ComF family protein [Pseudomonadales bacterium]|nr:ComF family protein [Pseudomonadales bacterium]